MMRERRKPMINRNALRPMLALAAGLLASPIAGAQTRPSYETPNPSYEATCGAGYELGCPDRSALADQRGPGPVSLGHAGRVPLPPELRLPPPPPPQALPLPPPPAAQR
jgi:hypothetical protein